MTIPQSVVCNDVATRIHIREHHVVVILIATLVSIDEHQIELQIQVIDALIEAGFLPRAIDTKQLRATLSEAIAEASKITGEATK